MKVVYLCTLFIFLYVQSPAQGITGIGVVWSDDLREWIFYARESEVGELKMRWRNQNDWREWDFRIGELAGTIEQKWRNNPNQWEVRCDNQIATARTSFQNNFREWRITDNNHQITLRTRYGNIADEWEVRSSNHGSFEMITTWEGDIRDWDIYDELNEDIPFSMRIALIFIVIYSTAPK